MSRGCPGEASEESKISALVLRLEFSIRNTLRNFWPDLVRSDCILLSIGLERETASTTGLLQQGAQGVSGQALS